MTDSTQEGLSRRKSADRAALFFLADALMTAVHLGLSSFSPSQQRLFCAMGLLELVFAALMRFWPWQRWPTSALLVPVPIVLALSGVWDVYGGMPAQVYALYFILTSVWVGTTFRPWTSVALAPMYATAYLVPLWIRDADTSAFVSGALALPVCVLVGETLSRMLAERDQSRRERVAALEVARDQALLTAQLKAEFLSTMSHEIRTPMNAVIGCGTLLLDTPLTPLQREYAEGIRRGGDALLSVVEDVLDFSRIDAGKLSLHPKPFELLVTVAQTVDLVARAEAGRGVAARVSSEIGLPGWVVGDAGRIRQVLLNLVGNAFKFSSGGEVCVALSRAGGAVRFSVKDTGPGIAGEDLAQLFQPFRQVHGGARRLREGAGLGLAISKKLVEAMGGVIGAESVVGEGATFWFELPLPECAAPTPPAPARAAPTLPQPRTASTRGRVLVVEDDKVNQLVTRRLLERLGYDADVADNGAEALRAVEDGGYVAVLMDCHMPQMDGFEATTAIRQREAASSERLPVIALTAAATEDERQKCLRAGMDHFLSKPVRADDLRKMIETVTAGTGGRALAVPGT